MKRIKVKRIAVGCCGMLQGEIYEAEQETPEYVRIVLPSGELTSEHWMKGFFEVVDEDIRPL